MSTAQEAVRKARCISRGAGAGYLLARAKAAYDVIARLVRAMPTETAVNALYKSAQALNYAHHFHDASPQSERDRVAHAIEQAAELIADIMISRGTAPSAVGREEPT